MKDWLLPDSRSAHRKGAHPVNTGAGLGAMVHQVGNHSSWENRKRMPERLSTPPSCVGISSQKRRRNRREIRMTFPISSLFRASSFLGGSAGENSTAPVFPGAACRTARGNEINARGASSVDVPAPSLIVTCAWPDDQFIDSTTAPVCIDTPPDINCWR